MAPTPRRRCARGCSSSGVAHDVAGRPRVDAARPAPAVAAPWRCAATGPVRTAGGGAVRARHGYRKTPTRARRGRGVVAGGAAGRLAVAGYAVPRRRRGRFAGTMDAVAGAAVLAGARAHLHALDDHRPTAGRRNPGAGRTAVPAARAAAGADGLPGARSEEHTSELQS